MRLHRLRLTAFGPFAGTETVDFDELCSAGLFLFTGATGAGKTSILDGVCFALYGQVPGARQQGAGRSSLRSDHAPEGLGPEVVLEVTLRDRRLRVTRSPAWERPKHRGTGTTTQQSRVLVEEADGDRWKTLSTRLDESGLLLDGLLGLSLAQFCQVVLLPQGQFAEFLRADADRRRALLESLFDTRRFADVEAWLVGLRQAAARALDELDTGLHQIVARVAEAAGSEPPDPLPAGEVHGWVDRLLATAGEARGHAGLAADTATSASLGAATALVEAERVGALQLRASALRERMAAVEAAQVTRDAAATELAEARRVAPLVPVLAEARRLQAELEDVRVLACAAHARVAGTLSATGTDGGPGLPPALLVRRSARATMGEIAALRVLADQEEEADRLTREVDALQRKAVELAARAAKAADWLAGAADRRAQLEAARDHGRAAVARLPDSVQARDRCAARFSAAVGRDELLAQVGAARDDLRSLVDVHQEARDALQATRAGRLAGMAAELASSLRPGADCPVCGNAEHPHPAVSAGSPVTGDDEEAAAARTAEAEALRQHGESLLVGLELALAEQRSAAGGSTPVDDIRAELRTLSLAVDGTARAAQTAPGAQEQLVAFEREQATWQHERVAHDTEARTTAARVAEQRDAVAQLADQLSLARGEDASIAARRDRLQRAVTDLEGLASHLGDLERLERRASEALVRAETAVHEQDLTCVEEVAAAVRGDDRVCELETLCQQHDADLAAVTGALADAELVTALSTDPQDVAALRAVATETAAVRDAARAAALTAADRVRSLERLAGDLGVTLSRRVPLAERHRLVDALSRLAEGKSADSTLRMSLSAYVLAARLEQVATSASQRLLRMTSSRYSLVHTAHGAGGRARGGLTLRVLDAWTGQERDPATLSGGETFSASLALALGLADVVTAEAGGALLETLFVDEGFGSLDDDTLDDVMGVLDDLRDGGRTVGIVSHVADLRQRIPTQLRVDKGRNGSHVHQ